ncbi:MAG: MotA/TolQ/ExbB proton channel family protein [Desulfobacterales bacterium]|nr:MotA/TolQ/ExbB proton channel family protein [Desulfobacterales bacterium]
MITAQISLFSFYGARIILVILLFLSFFTVAFFIAKLLFFHKHFLKNLNTLFLKLEEANSKSEIKKLLSLQNKSETNIILKAIDSPSSSEFKYKVNAYFKIEKEKWESFTLFLGTVGNNAPFIGLLGTVLGILKAFADLGLTAKGGPQVVMSGISEALIATAVGLFVAIPAVIFFNICKAKIKKASIRVEALIDIISSKNI